MNEFAIEPSLFLALFPTHLQELKITFELPNFGIITLAQTQKYHINIPSPFDDTSEQSLQCKTA